MQNPIAIFDSGLGGLTVMRQVAKHLPAEDIVYFGDTARVPYGTKSPETIERFATEIVQFLLRFSPKVIVVACNTVSATALPALQILFELPIFGVVIPGCAAALRASRSRRIGVIGTEATVAADAYRRTIVQNDPSAVVVSRACPLLVPIVEEGRTADDPIVAAVLEEYLAPLKKAQIDTLVLGCTHYPLLRPAVERTMGDGVAIVDSAVEVAKAVHSQLESSGLLRQSDRRGEYAFYASDNAERFARIGRRFLGRLVQNVQHVVPDEDFLAPAVGVM